VRLLERAARLEPGRADIQYRLGLAYHAVGDEADAANALREAAQRMPDSAAIHNDLGIALFQSGDARASVEEFQTAVRLAATDPNVRFNLAESLARAGETARAIEELRAASNLAPADAGLSRLVKFAEEAVGTPGGTIKVNVRQVLVPVVVTDQAGHSVSGLKQSDFRVFENGAEQKVTSFSVESSGSSEGLTETAAVPAHHSLRENGPAENSNVRRTYLIVVDTLHTSFTDFEAVRQALAKLFEREASPDSQYVMIALGTSPEIVHNVTTDAPAILAELKGKKFQKYFLDGQMGGLKPEMDRYMRDLNETRVACDLSSDRLMQVKCEAGQWRTNNEARQIAETDRVLTAGFLREFRDLIAQLARGRDRRTVILISGGFQLTPGKEARELFNAFFPPASHCLVPGEVICVSSDRLEANERMQSQFEPILRLAARSNITIDTIDSRGLYGQKSFDAATLSNSAMIGSAVGHVQLNSQSDDGNTLMEIADATGGTAFRNNNDLFAGLQRAFADGRDYYMLSYASPNGAADGKFRAITVLVNDRKVIVKAKRGYWAEPEAQ
jgi:VWFA-related protein